MNKGYDTLKQTQTFSRLAMLCVALLVAYKLILISYNGLVNFSNYGSGGKILALISSYAWFAFTVMGSCWVFDKRLGMFFPVTGTIAGGISILTSIVGIILMPFVLVLLVPLVKFAYHIASFHYAENANER